jgi:hypothetical protein
MPAQRFFRSDKSKRPSPTTPQDKDPPREDLPEEVDEFVKGWHDSSFELRRGLWVIETDLDPSITHGIDPRAKNRQGR